MLVLGQMSRFKVLGISFGTDLWPASRVGERKPKINDLVDRQRILHFGETPPKYFARLINLGRHLKDWHQSDGSGLGHHQEPSVSIAGPRWGTPRPATELPGTGPPWVLKS